jgi:predicted nucleic acid-binding Zn ribbon protein
MIVERETCPHCTAPGIEEAGHICLYCGMDIGRCFICNIPMTTTDKRFCSDACQARYKKSRRRLRSESWMSKSPARSIWDD